MIKNNHNKTQYIERKRVWEQLQNMDQYSLGIIYAPMGYGKTTEVRNFYENQDVDLLWINLTGVENDPVDIWKKVVTEIEKKKFPFKKKVEEIIKLEETDRIGACIKLINRMLMGKRLVCVIDNYEKLVNKTMEKYIEMLVKEDVEKFQLIIVTEKKPNINLKEMIITSKAYLIELEQLALDEQEIDTLFRKEGIELSKETLTGIYEYTEGWLAGVYYVKEYYTNLEKNKPASQQQQVLQKLVIEMYPRDKQVIFVILSYIQYFRVEEVMGTLEEMFDGINFEEIYSSRECLGYNKEREVWYIKPLFTTYLQERLHTYPIQIQKKVYKCLGEIYFKKKELIPTVTYLEIIEDYEEIAKALAQEWARKQMSQEGKLIQEIYSKIKEKFKRKYPNIYVNYIYFYLIGENVGKARWIVQHEMHQICQLNEQYRKYLKEESIPISNRELNYSDIGNLSFMHCTKETNYIEVVKNLIKEIKANKQVQQIDTIVWTEVIHAEYHLMRGELKKTRKLIDKAYYRMELSASRQAEFYIVVLSMKYHIIRGNYAKFFEVYNEYGMRYKYCECTYERRVLEILKQYVYAYTYQINDVSAELIELKPISLDRIDSINILEDLLRGQILLANKEFHRLEVLCEVLNQKYKKYNKLLGVVYVGIYEVFSKYYLYGVDEAKKQLVDLFKLVEKEQIIFPFLRQEEEYYELLILIEQEEKYKEYTCKIRYQIDEIKKQQDTIDSIRVVKSKSEVEVKWGRYGFTTREEEIALKLIEQKTNREIAEELYIANITVGKSISNIYKKLNVRKRLEAIDKLRFTCI